SSIIFSSGIAICIRKDKDDETILSDIDEKFDAQLVEQQSEFQLEKVVVLLMIAAESAERYERLSASFP
ncbi:8844_t:CDS:2, partial [Funneliformis mosseae]